MRRATTLIALLGLLVAALAAAGPAQAKRGMAVTIQDDAEFVYGGYAGYAFDQAQALDKAAALGVTRIRTNLSWAKVLGAQANKKKAPKNPHYDWAPWDRMITAAAARGMRVQITLAGFAPAWATRNHKVGVIAPKARYFSQFANAAAKHFGKRVKVWSIWNEPNIKPQLAPLGRAPKIYRGLYQAGYKAIRKHSKGAQILFAETNPYGIKGRATDPITFVRKVTCVNARYHKVRKCKRLVADGYAHHPYDWKHRPTFKYPGKNNATIGTLSHLTRALTKLRKARVLSTRRHKTLPVDLTEFGYYATGPRALPEAKRARYLVKGFKIAYRNPHVRSNLAYLLAVPPVASSFPMGLIRPTGANLRSYTALKAWAKKAHVKKKPKRIHIPPAP
jgi:hypothetical protein